MFLWNKGKRRGCFARGVLPACMPPHQPPPASLSTSLSWEQGLNQQGTSSHNLWSSGSPLVLTVHVCTCVCVRASTPAWQWDVFVGSSFHIWFSTRFFVNFCSFFSLHSFPARVLHSSDTPRLLSFSRFLPIPLTKLPSWAFFSFFFFFTPVVSVQQAFSECWAPARFLG